MNAGNVLGTEDNGPARKWLALIRKTLNSKPGTGQVIDPLVELYTDFEGSTRRKTSFQSMSPSDCDTNSRWGSSESDDETDSPVNMQSFGESFAMEETNNQNGHSRYCLAASKQMVGIFLTVWVKNDLRDDVRDMKVSCVGRGLMGYLGNKV